MNEHESGFLLCLFWHSSDEITNCKTSTEVIVISLFTFAKAFSCRCNWPFGGKPGSGGFRKRIERFLSSMVGAHLSPHCSSDSFLWLGGLLLPPLFTWCFSFLLLGSCLPSSPIIAALYSPSASVEMIPEWLYERGLIIRRATVTYKVNSVSLGPHLWQ